MANMQILLSTTGTQSTVTITDLGNRSFVHPTTNFNLLDEYNYVQTFNSSDLQSAIDNGYITLQSQFNESIINVKNMPIFNAESILNVPVINTTIGDQRVLVYNSTLQKLEYKNNSGRGVPTFSGSFFNSNTPYLEYNSTSFDTAMYFPYEGSNIITLSKLSAIVSTSSANTSGEIILYDENNLAQICSITWASDSVQIQETTGFANIPTSQAVFSLRARKITGNGKIRIHSIMLY